MKTLIVSDLHLGSRASSAWRQLDSLARVANGFDRVIFNGDTLDYCYTDPNKRGEGENQRFLAAVRGKCGGRNGPPILLSGNHDAFATEQHYLYDDESQSLIFHGDTLADFTHPTKTEDQKLSAKLAERWLELGGRPVDFELLHQHYRAVQMQWMHAIIPVKKSKTVLQYAKSLLYPPRRPFDVVEYWHRAPGRVLKVARGFPRTFKHIIFGHSHRGGHWNIDGVKLFNSGSFMPLSKPLAVLVEDAQVRIVPLRQLIDALPAMLGATAASDNSKMPVQI